MKDEGSLYETVDIVILAIKPQVFPEVISLLQASKHRPILVSIAGGIDLSYLDKHFPNQKIIRVMPNLAATIGQSVSVYAKNSHVTSRDESIITSIFSSIGTLHLIKEEWMDGVVALNGSFPAYLYRFIEGMVRRAVADGFPEAFAKQLLLETMLGSTLFAMQDERSFTELISDICSPKGITLEGIKVLEEANIDSLQAKVYDATKTRSIELRKEIK
jgi:pyrroline-5-carboxylate reductase